MKCKKGHDMYYTFWNTEEGNDEGWYCPECDVYYPNYEARRSESKDLKLRR